MIEERYLNATKAKNLRDEPHQVGQVDLIKANGMSAGNMASHFLRLLSKPSREDLTRVYAALLHVATKRGFSDPQLAITTAIEWMLDPRCKLCHGAGEEERGGKIYKCVKCAGEKLRREPTNKDVQALIDYVNDCRRSLDGRKFRLLR